MLGIEKKIVCKNPNPVALCQVALSGLEVDRGAMRNVQEQKQRTPRGLPRGVQALAMTYFPSEKYHRRQRLNCCVRDGNRCFPLPIFTNKPATTRFRVAAGQPRTNSVEQALGKPDGD